jgi:hypothetical protein
VTSLEILEPFQSWHAPCTIITAELDRYGLWRGVVCAGSVVVHESRPCLTPQEASELAASWVRPTQPSLFAD